MREGVRRSSSREGGAAQCTHQRISGQLDKHGDETRWRPGRRNSTRLGEGSGAGGGQGRHRHPGFWLGQRLRPHLQLRKAEEGLRARLRDGMHLWAQRRPAKATCLLYAWREGWAADRNANGGSAYLRK